MEINKSQNGLLFHLPLTVLKHEGAVLEMVLACMQKNKYSMKEI